MNAQSILVVDDDDVFRQRLARALTDRGYHVTAARGFSDALEAVRRRRFDFAVVDLRMEGKSGLELLAEIHPIDPSMLIVVLTGFASIATAVEAMRLGATNYVAKPADVDEIVAALDARQLDAERAEFPKPSLAKVEWEYIHQTLVECGGNISEAARRLGMHRRTLQRKLGKTPPDPR